MLKVEILTPERLVLATEGEEIVIPTASGVIGVRTGHVPLIAPLKAGEIVVKKGKELEHLAVAGGFVEIHQNNVRVMADSAAHATELDLKAIEEAVARAQKAKEEAKDGVGLTSATAALEMYLAQRKVAQRRHSRSHHSPDISGG